MVQSSSRNKNIIASVQGSVFNMKEGLEIKQNNSAVDFAKFVLSFFVCAIHSMGGLEWQRPWRSIAVPMFFVFSGYFFFSKWDGNHSLAISLKEKYLPFLRRTALLYAIWFVIWLPVNSVDFGKFEESILYGIAFTVYRILLASTFSASWYLAALMIGVFIVCCLSKKISDRMLIIVFGCLYGVCVLVSNYRGMFSEDGLFQKIFVYTYPGTIYNSFPAGLFYLTVGKLITEKQWNVKVNKKWILTGLALVIFYGEYLLIKALGYRVDDDCYFTLMLAAPLMASSVLATNIKIKHARIYRHLSIINYCMHGGIIVILTKVLSNYGEISNEMLYLVKFGVTEAICISAGLLILWLEKKKNMIWLRYVH